MSAFPVIHPIRRRRRKREQTSRTSFGMVSAEAAPLPTLSFLPASAPTTYHTYHGFVNSLLHPEPLRRNELRHGKF